MFDVALYTDTRANEAIDGIDGFNFQAISEGMNAQDRQVIRDTMLHRVVVGWNADHDPLEHPPSFAYCEHAGRYYLSRGISTVIFFKLCCLAPFTIIWSFMFSSIFYVS